MKAYAIFLTKRPDMPPFDRDLVLRHCRHLRTLSRDVRFLAGGPFGDEEGGGMYAALFETIEEAAAFAARDPLVADGYETATVRPWHPARAENGFLGVLPPEPGTFPGFLDALRLRATTRRFADRPVDEEMLRRVLEVALAAPSEFNLQPWRAVVCATRAEVARLAPCCFDQPQVRSVPAAVVCAADPDVFLAEAPRAARAFAAAGRWKPEEVDAQTDFIRSCYDDPVRARDSAIRNATIFAHHLLLAGFSQGLAGFWLGGVDEGKLRAVFGIPDRVVIAGVVGIGHADEPVEPQLREPFARTLGFGRYPG